MKRIFKHFVAFHAQAGRNVEMNAVLDDSGGFRGYSRRNCRTDVRGTYPIMSQQTRVFSRTTHTNGGPLSRNDFSNFTNSLSPTPELQYTCDGTSEYVHPCRHSMAVGHWCNERNTADGMHSRCPVTTSKGLRAAGSRSSRL